MVQPLWEVLLPVLPGSPGFVPGKAGTLAGTAFRHSLIY